MNRTVTYVVIFFFAATGFQLFRYMSEQSVSSTNVTARYIAPHEANASPGEGQLADGTEAPADGGVALDDSGNTKSEDRADDVDRSEETSSVTKEAGGPSDDGSTNWVGKKENGEEDAQETGTALSKDRQIDSEHKGTKKGSGGRKGESSGGNRKGAKGGKATTSRDGDKEDDGDDASSQESGRTSGKKGASSDKTKTKTRKDGGRADGGTGQSGAEDSRKGSLRGSEGGFSLISDVSEDGSPYKNSTRVRSISGAYKGLWEITTISSHTNFTREMQLKESQGEMVLHVDVKEKTKLRDVHCVYGDVIMHDGEYTTSRDARFVTVGLYLADRRRLFLFGNPTSGGSATDLVMSLGPNIFAPGNATATAVEMIQKGIDLIANRKDTRAREAMKSTSCLFMIEFDVEQLPGTIRDRSAEWDREMWSASRSNPPKYNIVGTLSSVDCGVEVSTNTTSIDFEKYYDKAIHYALMVSFVAFIQIGALITQMEATNTQSASARVSIFTIGAQAIMDVYLCLIHLTTGIVAAPLFNSFSTVACFLFVLFSIYEMRYMLLIWKAIRPVGFNDGMAGVRREISLLYSRFYGCMIMGMMAGWHLQDYMPFLLVLAYSYWVPQIVTNAIKASKNPLTRAYVIKFSFTRLVVPYYVYGCPENFLNIEPNPGLCTILAIWTVTQIVMLEAQSLYGPRCFIPARFLPEQYDYHRPLGASNGDLGCVICMNPVDPTPKNRMLAPCNHLFHVDCLKQWMEIKMECPTCRSPLPEG